MKLLIVGALVLASACSAVNAQGLFSYDYQVGSVGIGINSESDDYAPTMASDQSTLFFTSNRESDNIGEADIMLTRRNTTGDPAKPWVDPVNPGSPLNTSGNDGALAIAGDGRTVVVAADDRDGGLGSTDLYIGDLVEGRVENLRNIGSSVNSTYWDSQPTISVDGRTIYFASNRKGGTGGSDIYVTHSDNAGNWSEAENMGSAINTRRNERSPYISPDNGSLFFASNGQSGFGGYDLFITLRDAQGWSQPTNLGSRINSEDDELFMIAPSRFDRFYFASSRQGGAGGLDIYYGTPNVFGNGIARAQISLLDSATRTPLPGFVSIIDRATHDTIATFTANPRGALYEQILPAGRAFTIVARLDNGTTRSVDVEPMGAGKTQPVQILFGGISLAEFNLGRYNVPFFVTGYYRPNTPSNLENLFSLIDGPLSEATYIERFRRGSARHKQYQGYAEAIETILETVNTVATKEILPQFNSDAGKNEVLVITITGYADPQPFVGQYVEAESVTFEQNDGTSRTVNQDDQIGNLELSGLRAWFAGHELDLMLRHGSEHGTSPYSELLAEGRVRLRYVGGGESHDSKNFASQRRIHIEMSRLGGGAGDQVVDFNSRLH